MHAPRFRFDTTTEMFLRICSDSKFAIPDRPSQAMVFSVRLYFSLGRSVPVVFRLKHLRRNYMSSVRTIW